MGKFNSSGRKGGKQNSNYKGNGSGFGSYSRNSKQMHHATCSECGDDCEIPFKPRDGRPVFCSNCFQAQDKPSFGNSRKNNRGRSNYSDKQMFEAVCESCGEECEVPFRPTGDKPVYCSTCFDKNRNTGAKNNDQYQEYFQTINEKLDKILEQLDTKTTSTNKKEVVIEVEPADEPKEDKKEVEKKPSAKKEAKSKTKPAKTTKKKAAPKKKATKK